MLSHLDIWARMPESFWGRSELSRIICIRITKAMQFHDSGAKVESVEEVKVICGDLSDKEPMRDRETPQLL